MFFMGREDKLFWVLFISLIIILIFIATLNYDSINNFIEANVETYGYPAIFLFSFLCDAIDQPIVPEVPAVLGVIYKLDVMNVFLTAVLGIWLVSIINFNIGKIVFKKKIKDLFVIKKYAYYCNLFQKYGKLALLLAALTPLPYVTFVWLSGAFGMKFKTFFVFGMIAKSLRLGAILLLFVIVFL